MNPSARSAIRYEADETPPGTLVLGLGLQLVVVSISFVVLLAAIVFRAGGAEEFLLWGVFAAVLCAGYPPSFRPCASAGSGRAT